MLGEWLCHYKKQFNIINAIEPPNSQAMSNTTKNGLTQNFEGKVLFASHDTANNMAYRGAIFDNYLEGVVSIDYVNISSNRYFIVQKAKIAPNIHLEGKILFLEEGDIITDEIKWIRLDCFQLVQSEYVKANDNINQKKSLNKLFRRHFNSWYCSRRAIDLSNYI